MGKLTFAVLVDGENAAYSDYLATLEEVEKYGTVAIKWVYADWTSPNQNGWKDILKETASSPKQQFHYAKDAADHALVMDAIELIITNPRITGVCIVSSDGGFGSLAQRIREKGQHVMAIGQENTPEHFRRACHNFVYTKNLSVTESSNVNVDLAELLIEAYQRCALSQERVYLGDMGTILKQINSSFDCRNYNFQTLGKLIKQQSGLFDVDIENSSCYITLKNPIKDSEINTMNGKVRKLNEGKDYGFIRSDAGDFHFKLVEITSKEQTIKQGSSVMFDVNTIDLAKDKSKTYSPSAFNIRLAS
ncbi:MAG: NYN domain-containing protein [Psychrobium sp.]|nr:NYN domain-containing protein [Psychrobium sp.]